MTYDEFLLALVMWREARGEGEIGMLAVGHVIVNRTRAWRQSYHDAIIGQNQFSSMTIRGDSQTVLYPSDNDPVFALAASVYDGSDLDQTNGALYYANESVALGGWYRTNIIDNPAHPRTATIGKHTFRS